MSAKEKYLRRLLLDAEFYLNNIDNDDPQDLVADAMKVGRQKHPVDTAIQASKLEGDGAHQEHKEEEENGAAGLGEAKFFELIEDAEKLIDENLFEKETFRILSRESIILYIELALRSKKRDATAERILDFVFEHTSCEDQFYIRGLFSKAIIEFRKVDQKGFKAEKNLEQTMASWKFMENALSIITKPENKLRYEFLTYNSAIVTYQILRPLLKPGWSKHFVAIIEKLSNLLEEKDDADFNFRIRYLSWLWNAYLDAEKKAEGLKINDKLYDLTKKVKECSFQEVVIRNRMHIYRDNNGQLAAIKKDAETGADPMNIKALCVIQQIKSGVIQENQIEKELTTVMATLSPAAISMAEGGSGEGKAPAISKKLSKFDQDRMAEAGRMAIKHGLIALWEGACNVISRSTQGSLRAKIWTEYNKAELTLKKTGKINDPITGMKLSLEQQQSEEFERRIEALKILERAMIANRRLGDPDVIIEGCVLIWNTAIPLLKSSTRSHVYKPFTSASNMLEQIQANESKLRVCLYLELAKFEIEQDFISKAEEQIRKAMLIDYSLARESLQIDLKEDEEPGNFQREYERILHRLKKWIDLRLNIYGEPDSEIDQMILDVENAKSTTNIYLRETLIDKVLQQLLEHTDQEFELTDEEEIKFNEDQKKAALIKYKKSVLSEKKQRVLLASEISQLAFNDNLVELAFDSAKEATKNQWDQHKDTDLVISQCKAHYVIAQCYVEMLLEEEIEVGFNDLITISEDQEEREFTEEDAKKFQGWKISFVQHIQNGVKLAMSTLQPALIFRGAILFWNNYLPIFKRLDYYEVVLKECVPVMQEWFEGMNNTFITSNFGIGNIDYNLNTKLNVFTNFSHVYCRIQEKHNSDEALRVCNLLLEKNLPPHLRKSFDTVRARITKQVKGPEKAGDKGGKGKQEAPAQELSETEIISAEVIGLLEMIATNIQNDKNASLNMIKEGMDKLTPWKPNDKEEIELELHAELWWRLGRLAIMLKSTQGSKIALFWADNALNGVEKVKKQNKDKIPKTRLRWYAVAQGLFGESIGGLIDENVQDKESIIRCCENQIVYFVKGCELASKANLSFLMSEMSKLMWNALLPMLDAAHNRKKLIDPMSKVHELLMNAKENNDPEFLVLFYHGLFKCITEEKEWKLGEKIVDEAFTYVPQTHQKVLWEAKAMYLSKLGKNVLNAISNMKEGDATLQAKVWVKLAKIFSEPVEQHMAFNKAIEILTKEESVEVVEVLIDYAEWLHRNEYPSLDVEDQLLLAVDVLLDIEPGWDDEEEGQDLDENTKTKKSKRSRGSRASKVSKAKSRMSKVSRKTGKTAKRSVAGKSTMSKASRRTAMTRTTNRTKKTKTALSRRENEDPQPFFLTVSHYDKLFRIHSMLAYITYEQKEVVLDAQFFIIKMWEQSFKTLNAFEFLNKHKEQAEQLGFNEADPDARINFYNEVFTNPDVQMPSKFDLPESSEGWINFDPPQEFIELSKKHEDKTMIAKWAFQKPEITLYHIGNILQILESHYLHIQMIPVLKFAKLYSSVVIENEYYKNIFDLKLTRIWYNFGLQISNESISQKIQKLKLSEATKQKLIQENATGESVVKADYGFKEMTFPSFDKKEPPKTEIWKEAAVECLKFGDYLTAKDLIMETSYHSRILKEQNNYAECFKILSIVAELEGEPLKALKMDMYCQMYAKDLRLICETINITLKHLLSTNNPEAGTLMAKSLEMMKNLMSKKDDKIINPELYFAMQHVYLDYAYYMIVQMDKIDGFNDDKVDKFNDTTIYLDDYDTLVQQSGTKIEHIIKCMEISKMLYSWLNDNWSLDESYISHIEDRLTRGAKLLLKSQEYLNAQVSLLPISQNLQENKAISHPLKRLLGIVKLRLAQANSEIGVFRTMLKGQVVTEGDAGNTKEIVDQWMELISKQIDAQAKTVKVSISTYEKSIILLNNAMNLLDPKCEEYLECIVEVAKCKRLLAVQKKHLRAVWRQDALDINDKLNESLIDEDNEMHDDFEDVNANYQEEALKSFVEILSNEDLMKRIVNHNLFDQSKESLLATLAIEYAEWKGNLNKEQCFASLALYQNAISRKELLNYYYRAWDASHPDMLRKVQLTRAKDDFKLYSSPLFPESISKNEEKLKNESKALKNINASFNYTEEIKSILPHSSAYLILQFSPNMKQLYVGFWKISKDQKFEYYLTKLTLSDSILNDLSDIKDRIKIMWNSMFKTPITIQEDLDIIENEAEEQLASIIDDTETFLNPILAQLNDIINPLIEEAEGDEAEEPVAKKGKEPPKQDPKKGAKDELAKYESNLPLPSSGIESLVLLLDSRLSRLPVEAWSIFDGIPVITRDFSLHSYTNRLMNLGHKAELHNNKGIAKDNLTYIYDAPSNMHDSFKTTILDEQSKLIPGSQWRGVNTQEHIPSDGEWQRLLQSSSLFVYFSMTALVHTYPPFKLAETSSISGSNAAIILDRMNSYKPLVNKEVLTSKHFSEKDQPEQTAALFTVLGLNTILTNQWSVCPEENMKIYRGVLESIGTNGKYLGAAFERHEKEVSETVKNEHGEDEIKVKKIPRKRIYRYNTICYGVPLNRIS